MASYIYLNRDAAAVVADRDDEIFRLRQDKQKLIDGLEVVYFENTYGPHMGMSGNLVGARLRAIITDADANR